MNLIAAATDLLHRLRNPFRHTVPNAVQCLRIQYDEALELWVFDDPRHGLVAEPFVHGATEAIDRAVQRKFGERPASCRVIFAPTPLPKADLQIRRIGDGVGAERTGCLYWDVTETDGEIPRTRAQKADRQLWLCPALCHYFGKAPAEIYASLERRD